MVVLAILQGLGGACSCLVVTLFMGPETLDSDILVQLVRKVSPHVPLLVL